MKRDKAIPKVNRMGSPKRGKKTGQEAQASRGAPAGLAGLGSIGQVVTVDVLDFDQRQHRWRVRHPDGRTGLIRSRQKNDQLKPGQQVEMKVVRATPGEIEFDWP